MNNQTSWQQLATFLDEVERAKDRLDFRPDEACFYRGHRSADFELLPTLQRHCQKVGIEQDLKAVQDLEGDLFFEFQARSSQLVPQGINDWDLLITMRHHGVATRLLDWTETLGVALYFALDGATDADRPRLWLLNPWRLNEENWHGLRDLVLPKYLGRYRDRVNYEDYGEFLQNYEPPGMELARPVTIYPNHLNSRLHAQRGYFTMHGDLSDSLDLLNPDCVGFVDIPEDVVEPARRFLSVAGIDDYLMFPDLDGLARDLHRKTGINRARPAGGIHSQQARGAPA